MEGVVIDSFAVVHQIVVARLMPVTASVAIHVALAWGLMLPAWTAPRDSVLLLELIEPETPSAPNLPPPARPAPRPLTLPRPIKTPMPAPADEPAPVAPPVEPPRPRAETPPEPPAPAVVAPAPPTAAPPPSDVSTPAPVASTPPSAGSASPFAQASVPGPPPSASTFTTSQSAARSRQAGPAVAALPPADVTQHAIPRGGYQYRPSYPASARARGIQGTTLLGVLVADDGRVAEVVVKQSAGHPDLDHAAADAVRRWRFEPARRGSEPVAIWVLLPVEFKLR